jgi:polysaccharide export outer membrane protein
MNKKLLHFFLFLTLSSCNPTRNLVYFSNLKGTEEYREEIKNKTELKIQPDDMLSITVNSLNPESNALFNRGTMPTASNSSAGATSTSNEGYLVDKGGNINFPVLGTVKLIGLTKEQAADKIKAEIQMYLKKPIVNVRLLNFRITVLGEVNSPATFAVPTEKMNLLEALSQAGDLTPYGRRSNVLIIREENGVRSTIRVDLNDKAILNSPYFYLQQNDVLYVEPVKVKALQGGTLSLFLPIVTATISILSLLIAISR